MLISVLLFRSALAENIEYDFELIVFEDISGRYDNSEQWQHQLHASYDHTANPSPKSGYSSGEPTLSNISQIAGLGLKKYVKKLDGKKRYNVLVHKAWRQTGLSDDTVVDIPVASNSITSTAHGRTNDPKNEIRGSIRVVLGRYLHFYTDLTYRRPLENVLPAIPGAEAQSHQEFPIRFHRRMRSKELHYIDHPLVGILVMAMPVKNVQSIDSSS